MTLEERVTQLEEELRDLSMVVLAKGLTLAPPTLEDQHRQKIAAARMLPAREV